jgi:4-hydroxy-tetrahydrodipicolinate synthase
VTALSVLAAVLTPLDTDLEPDHQRLAGHCRWLLANGCDGLSVLGTTGEANSFSVGERLEILERLIGAGIPSTALLPGTGCCAPLDTIQLTRQAVELRVAGVLMLPPFYYKNVSDDGLYASFARVIEGVGSDRLRLYLYHFPQMTGVPFGVGLIERLRADFPGIVVGMKDSSGNLAKMLDNARGFSGFSVLTGFDDGLLPLLEAGGSGCITGVCNVAAPLIRAMMTAFRERRSAEAGRLHERLSGVRAAFSAYPLTAALKEILARHSGDSGWRRLRPPLVPLTGEQGAALTEALRAVDFRIPPL